MSNDERLASDRAALDALLGQAECLISPEQMQAAYDRMAEEIAALLADTCPIVVVVMTGGLVAAGQLLSRLTFPLEVEFVHATRYRGTRGGAIEWRARPERDWAGRHVLLIDDLFDEGVTLSAVREWCEAQGAARVQMAVAALKALPNRSPMRLPEFVGVTVPDRFIFGEGLDYSGFFRNLPGIHALKTKSLNGV